MASAAVVGVERHSSNPTSKVLPGANWDGERVADPSKVGTKKGVGVMKEGERKGVQGEKSGYMIRRSVCGCTIGSSGSEASAVR